MRGIGVTAAVIVLALAASGCQESKASFAHSCGATDKDFIETAGLSMVALSIWSEGYRSGEIGADEVVEETQNAAHRVNRARPKDASLQQAQRYLDAMFTEYGQAVALHADGKNAGERMFRAYGLASFARDVLLEAQPELHNRGCDVGPLL